MGNGRSEHDRERRGAPVDTSPFSAVLTRQWLRGRSWEGLLNAWRISTEMLAHGPSPRRHFALVVLRGAILDEMEAREPRAFTLWLSGQQSSRDSGSAG
jgi:hypothetical protein